MTPVTRLARGNRHPPGAGHDRAKWGVETLVNTNVAGNQALPTVVGLTGGGYVISWTDLDVAGGDGNSHARPSSSVTTPPATSSAAR